MKPAPSQSRRRPKVGLALGGGSARGWAHIGVLRALAELDIHPDLICGTSIGALVGAAYAVDELERLEEWVLGMKVGELLRFVDVSLSAGLIKGERLTEYLRNNFGDRPIESMALPYAAVATRLSSGAEVWLRSGSIVDAIRASIALPGIFKPIAADGDFLVDGGLVNPVPVSLARALGADIVIAVDLNTDLMGRYLERASEMEPENAPEPTPPEERRGLMQRLQSRLGRRWSQGQDAQDRLIEPSMFSVLASSLNIMQVRITRSRMAGDPPDVLITPRLAHMSLYDFHRGEEAMLEGRRATMAARPQLVPFGLAPAYRLPETS